ncbi:auxin-responsive protein IAA4-like [Phalaenopsis equestris]|uniref:auxin-responsive protein IAA4-like n=1 Tax=Phalaenopsis equestris TaxID=78828 RepID=UPI0009E59928|nr:auxin-responsive protein IAA4-like [Phalaenopsis equestris]
MEEHENSSSSSSNSSSHPLLPSSSSSSFCNRKVLSTDLRIEMQNQNTENLFVKVYMEGIPIGRKLDLLTQDGYQSLIRTLQEMFRTTIIREFQLQIYGSASSFQENSHNESSSHPLIPSSSSFCNRKVLSTDLRLGLRSSASSFQENSHYER